MKSALRRLSLIAALALTASAFAHEGHDHGAPLPPAVYEPRFEARAGDVEVVGVLEGEALWLYVSHYASNVPWPGLHVEVEQDDGKSASARAEGGGAYSLPAGTLARPGTYAVVLTVSGGGLDELLTAELKVAEPVAGKAEQTPTWIWGVAALVLAGGVFAVMRKGKS